MLVLSDDDTLLLPPKVLIIFDTTFTEPKTVNFTVVSAIDIDSFIARIMVFNRGELSARDSDSFINLDKPLTLYETSLICSDSLIT